MFLSKSFLSLTLLIFSSNGIAEMPAINIGFAGICADSLETEKEYFTCLKAADAETFKRDFEVYFLLLLSPKQKTTYENCKTLDECKTFLEDYWKASNPNPLLPENSWLLDFIERVQYAKKHFRRTSLPYVDARGIYYIKYGKPRRRFQDSGGPRMLEKKFSEQHIRYNTLPNETWSYENIQDNFVVYFVQEGISFREVESIYTAVLDRRVMRYATRKTDPNMEFYVWSDMVKKRESISIVLSQNAVEIRAIENGLLFYDPPQSLLKIRAEELSVITKSAHHKAPSAAQDPIPAKKKIEFYDRIAQFRGPNGKTRIAVTLLAPYEKNLVKKVKKSSNDTLKMEFSGMLRDLNFNSVSKNHTASTITIKSVAKEKLPNAVGKFMLLAAHQSAELTLQVAERHHEKTGYYRQPFEIRNFSTNSLLVSDIQLYNEVKTENEKKTLPTILLQKMQVSPYPYHQIRKKKPPLLYFEIYNIRSTGIQEKLQISYRITSLKKASKTIFQSIANALSGSDQASVSVTYTRPVTGENMEELIKIDLKNVKKGRHLLEVTVSSMQDSTIKATSWIELVVRK